MLLAIGLAVVGIFWLFQGHLGFQDIVGPLIFTFIVGNCNYFSALAAVPIYAGRSFPWDVIFLLAILIPASIAGGYLASIVTRFAVQQGDENLLRFYWPDILKCIFLSLVIAIPIYLSRKSRARLEMRNRELEGQVTLGQIELKSQEAELRAASEIQTQLLPREIPRVKGLEIACAWQPARSVGGDYFDVLALASNADWYLPCGCFRQGDDRRASHGQPPGIGAGVRPWCGRTRRVMPEGQPSALRQRVAWEVCDIVLWRDQLRDPHAAF